ncbi:MAG: DegT/DnrJ/EryC1/StrS family aminotransferase [Bacteroidales bacterium]|nr:DegT/DnrJ/EryC1/StrS family aminotransferase [Bacteroidales bacterium]
MKTTVNRASLPPFEEYCNEIKDLWDSHFITNMGQKHEKLQSALESYLGVPHVTLFSHGHLALESILRVFNFPEGGEVITSPFTFVSTTHAIYRVGLTPVFCDVLQEDGTLDPAGIEELITDKTVAILPVHVYGNVCDIEGIERIAEKHRLKIIYDAAHAFGVKYRGLPVVNYGDASILSFHATKIFSTIEGGAVCYRDDRLQQLLNDDKNFGIRDTETVVSAGGNGKMNEFQAAMGLCNLRHIDSLIEERRILADRYKQRLPSYIQFFKKRENTTENYAYMPVLFPTRQMRDKAFCVLSAEGIETRKYFYPLTSYVPCYQALPQNTPVAEDLSERVLCLPLYNGFSNVSIDLIINILQTGMLFEDTYLL